MPRRTISVPGLGHGAQPIPLGVAIGNVFVTGNISGVDVTSGTLPENVATEFENAFVNVGRALEAAGLGFGDIAKMDVLLRDLADRGTLNTVWLRYFPDDTDRPARHTTNAPLPNALNIQISILAVRE